MIGFRSHICAFFHNATKLNHVLPKYEDPVVCRYDLAKFGGDIVVDIIRTHPMIIVGGILQENPSSYRPISSSRNYVNAEFTAHAHLRIDLRITNAELAPRNQTTPELYQ